jgi:hypothetical protein
MGWRLAVIGVGVTVLTIVLLNVLSGVAGVNATVAVAVLLIVGTVVLLVLDRSRK